MKRRNFLRTAGTAMSVPMVLNGMHLKAMPKSSIFNFVNDDSDRVLVIIQLNGGNDGLNSVIPLDQYDRLANVRSNILIPQSNIIGVTDTIGFHPNMTGFKSLYDDGKLGIVQNVGYPNQNRSHFRSKDIWMSGSPSEEFWSSGWLGRYFDERYLGYPEGYPNDVDTDPFALTMGNVVSETCQGIASNYSLTLNNPFNLNQLQEGIEDELPDTPYGDELGFLRTSIVQTNAYAGVITSAAEAGNNMVDYPDNRLAAQLKNIALLIAGGLKTKIYIASMGGYDTHANQVVANDPTSGEHAELLQTLTSSVEAFQADIQQLGLEERVLGMTFSEFGRRIKSNESLGTDHGTAAPLFVFGSCINPTIIGENPEIAEEVDRKEGVPMEYDFRDIYGSVLMDWFEVDEDNVKHLLHEDFQYLPIVNGCNVTTSTDNKLLEKPIQLNNFPNPFQDWTTISFDSEGEWVRLSIMDTLGQEVQVLTNQNLPAGNHQIKFDGSRLPAGNYYYRLQLGQRSKAKLMIKI